MPDTLVVEILALARRLAIEASFFTNETKGYDSKSDKPQKTPFSPENESDNIVHFSRKSDNTVVTSVDLAIQSHIISSISAAYPDHAVIAEEQIPKDRPTPDPRSARYCWVVDPLDGTRNFVAGFPCFATSIAVLDQGVPIIGVVFEHNLGLEFYASLGGGAFQKTHRETQADSPEFTRIRRLAVIEPDPASDMLIGVPSTKDATTVAILQRWVATKGLILRNLGSTATHLALVASGALSAAFCYQCKIWDIAAGVLLVSEAGGVITDLRGQPIERFDLTASTNSDLPYVAGAPGSHAKLTQVWPST